MHVLIFIGPMMTTLNHTIDLLRSLIRFNTVSSNSNLELIHFVVDYLNQYGIESSLTYDETGEKANLFATIGNKSQSGICLSGHSDVVPTTGQNWNFAPFDLTEHEGKLYGRGTADMKGYLAVMLASVPHFLKHSDHMPFHLAISYDEEVGCVGVRHLLKELEKQSIKPLACIIGEPTSMQLAVAHKGKRAWRCSVKGHTGHSALTHLGVNAAEYGAEVVTYLRSLANQRREYGPHNSLFDPSYTTVHTGKIQSGTALNIIPEQAQIDFEVRNIPSDDPDILFKKVQTFTKKTLLPEMQAVNSNTGFDWDMTVSYPALEEIPESEMLRSLVAEILGSDQTKTLSFGTEGGLFQEIGIPTVVCGPGSMAQGHKADEFVEVSQLNECLRFMQRLTESTARLKTVT